MSRKVLWGVIAVAVLVVAAVIVVVTVVDTGGRDRPAWAAGDGDPGYRGYDLSKAPRQIWRVTPAGARSGMWLDPKTKWGANEYTGYIEDDGVVIVAGSSSPGVGAPGRKTVGINASDGTIRWQADTPGTGCSPLLSGHRIACVHDGDVDILGTGTGKRVSRFGKPDGGYDSALSLGSSLVFLGGAERTMKVYGGDDSGPKGWRLPGPITDGNTGWTSNGVVGTYCSSSIRATSSMVFDADGGQPRPASSTGCFLALAGGGFVESNPTETAVYTDAGDKRFASPHPMMFPKFFGAAGDHPIGIVPASGGVVDLVTGKEIWFSPVLVGDDMSTNGIVGVVGDVLVTLLDDGAALVGLSMRDGRQLWRLDGLRSYGYFSSPMSDGRRIVFRHSKEGLMSVDTTTGRRLWTLPDADDDTYSKTFLSGGRLVTVTAGAVTGYGWG